MNLDDRISQLVREAVEPMLTERLDRLEERMLERLVELVSGPPAPEPALLTLDEVASLLRVHPRTVQRRVAEGKLPAPVSVGSGRPRWRGADLDAWLDSEEAR